MPGASKLSGRIGQWQGILYCEQRAGNDRSDLAGQWGAFLLYGDCELLDRVRAAFTALGK